jgi:hypothetical protein
MHRRGIHDRPGAIVRRDRQLPGVGERRDATIEHDDARYAGL